MVGTVNASESTTGQGGGFRLVGKGTVNTNPFSLLVTGGPLMNVERDKPYHFTADVRGGADPRGDEGATCPSPSTSA